MEQNPSALQINEFFGLSGMQSLYGGGRGRVFFIEGVFVGDNTSINAAVSTLLSYDDGVGRVLVDSFDNAWPNVVFSRFQPPERVLPGAYPFKVQFSGMI